MIPISWYAIGALTLGLAAAIGYATIENAWRQQAELQVAHEQEANRRNQETIKTLRESKEIAEQIAKELSEQLAKINQQEEDDDAAVTELEGTDEEVKKYLDTPVPRKLRCLWGEVSECGDTNGSPDPR